ncbi:hypothetical protein DEU29_11315 [Idiomarina aquatica]|uniref:Uncharacterized protein n=1 Tax=Idiomarina aquatica TaxID=1327752 RepID=A0A4R6P223_9GAMM|nr:hypothetical protein [Idiomarina aquatica]TDP31246.1 hypothetical protein DEU29_11315 [Idiomarina aquatica]
MSKTRIAITAMVAGSVGYWLGISQSQMAGSVDSPMPTQFRSDAVETPELDVNQPTINQRQAVNTTEKPKRESSDNTAEVIGKHPFHFPGIYAQIARENSYYPKIVDRFASENGVSSWGISREGAISDLMQSDTLMNIDVEYLQCRLKTCLMRGVAESKDIAYQVYENYSKIQQWGYHFSGKEDEAGNYHFYVITHRQDD